MNVENPIETYYAECRNGEIIKRRYGFVAVSRLARVTQVIEHIWVHPDFRDADKESQLILDAYNNAKEMGCRYLHVQVNLNQPKVFSKHTLLVGLGFYPTKTANNELIYERRIGCD